jgi:hypothetical protein
VEAVSTDSHVIPPTLVVSDAILQEHYFDFLDDKTGLGATTTGYMNDRLTVQWI